MQYTDEQKKAIWLRDRNILVSAAAGSGKTRVLIDRIVHLMLESQVELSRILVVTFTRAAANEMMLRVRHQLEETLVLLEDQGMAAFPHLNQDQSLTRLISFVRKSIADLPEAHISTLHAYCIEVLRTYFYKANLRPDFRVGSDAQLNIERMKAARAALDLALEGGDPAFFDWYEAYGGAKGEKAIDLILNVYGFSQAQVQPDLWKRDVLDDLESQSRSEVGSRLIQWIQSVHLSELKRIENVYLDLFALCSKMGGPSPYIETLESDLNLLYSLRDAESLDLYTKRITNLKFDRMKTISSKKALELGIDPDLQAQVKGSRDALKSALNDLVKICDYPDHIQKDGTYMLRDVQILFKLLEDFEDRYQQKKNRMGLVDYNDLEHRMLELLDHEEVRKALRDSLDYIFFDEYQDANAVQETIIEKLKGEKNLFFVGDVKQSIYRFRLSDPNLFNRRAKAYASKADSETLYLTKNFRSRPEVLAFSNFLFKNLMTQSLGEIDYKSKGQSLVAGKSFDQTDPEALNLTLIDKDQEKNELDTLDPQALYICDQIKLLTDDSKGSLRYRYKDICILMRSPRTHIGDFEKALKNADIPYYSDVSEEQFSVQEVQTFIDLLRVIDNPHDDLALISVLLGPFCDFSEEDLAVMRIESPEASSFKEAAEKSTDPALSKAYTDFMETIDSYRKLLHTMDLGKFGWMLLSKTNYAQIVLSLSSGKKRLENVHAFLRTMESYASEGKGGLVGFLTYLDWVAQTRQSDLQPAAQLSDEDDVVRIMSIHKSKGLEFKVVMLCHLEKRFNMRDAREVLQMDDQIGIGMTLHDATKMIKHDSLAKKLIVHKQAKETKSEEMRLLYVALTRAEERIYLIGDYKASKSFKTRLTLPIEIATETQNDHMSWVLQGLLRSNQGKELREELEIPEPQDPLHLDYPVQTAIISSSDILSGQVDKKSDWREWLTFPDQKVIDHLKQIDAYVYPYLRMTRTAAKTTVSERSKRGPFLEADAYLLPENEQILQGPLLMSQAGLGEELHFQSHFRPKFTQTNRLFTGREQGTILHTVMRLLRPKNWTYEAVEQMLPQLVVGEWLTQEEAATIDPKKIVDFYASDLGQKVIHAAQVNHEASFTLRDNTAMIDGQIDLWFEDSEGLISIIDFKTDRLPNPNLYTEQLRLYALALSKAQAKPVRYAYLYWMSRGQISRFVLDF